METTKTIQINGKRVDPLAYLSRLCPRDQLVGRLYYELGFSQRCIGEMLDPEQPYPQPSIQYMVTRIEERIGYLRWLDTLRLDSETVRRVARSVGIVDERADMLATLWDVQNYTSLAEAFPDVGNGPNHMGAVKASFQLWLSRARGLSGEQKRVLVWLENMKPKMLREVHLAPVTRVARSRIQSRYWDDVQTKKRKRAQKQKTPRAGAHGV